MKTVTKAFEVFSYDELSENSQLRVINNLIEYFMSIDYEILVDWYPELIEPIEHANKMQTAWFTGEYIWDECKELCMRIINDDDYLVNGEIFSY